MMVVTKNKLLITSGWNKLVRPGRDQFGNFAVSESASVQPIFINPKSSDHNPTALRVASKLCNRKSTCAQIT